MSPAEPPTRGTQALQWRGTLVIFCVAVGLRWLWLGWQAWRTGHVDRLPFDDEQWYWFMARSIAAGEGLVGEFGHRAPRMPLYPWMLSLFAQGVNGIAWAKGFQCLVGALAAVFTARLAAELAGRRVGVVAGVWVAIDPLLIGVSTLLLTETLFVTLLAAYWWSLWRVVGSLTQVGSESGPPARSRIRQLWIHVVIVSVLGVLAILTRPSSLAIVAVAVLFVLMAGRWRRRSWCVAGTMVLLMIVGLFPWAWRNYGLTDRWTWLDHRAGISLYDGVRPGATGASDLGDIKDMPEVRGFSEAEWDAYFRREAWRAIRTEPLRIVRLGFVKLGRMWSPVLHADEYSSTAIRLGVGVWSIALYTSAALGFWSLRKRVPALAFLISPAILLSLIHALYIGSVRYRVGAMPTLAVLAAMGVFWLVDLRRGVSKRIVNDE